MYRYLPNFIVDVSRSFFLFLNILLGPEWTKVSVAEKTRFCLAFRLLSSLSTQGHHNPSEIQSNKQMVTQKGKLFQNHSIHPSSGSQSITIYNLDSTNYAISLGIEMVLCKLLLSHWFWHCVGFCTSIIYYHPIFSFKNLKKSELFEWIGLVTTPVHSTQLFIILRSRSWQSTGQDNTSVLNLLPAIL